MVMAPNLVAACAGPGGVPGHALIRQDVLVLAQQVLQRNEFPGFAPDPGVVLLQNLGVGAA